MLKCIIIICAKLIYAFYILIFGRWMKYKLSHFCLNIIFKNMKTVKTNISEHSPGINLSVILSSDPQQLLEMNNAFVHINKSGNPLLNEFKMFGKWVKQFEKCCIFPYKGWVLLYYYYQCFIWGFRWVFFKAFFYFSYASHANNFDWITSH